MVIALIDYCLQLFYRRAYRMQQEQLDRVLKRKREKALRRVSGQRQWRRQALRQPSSWCQDGKGSSREIIPCLHRHLMYRSTFHSGIPTCICTEVYNWQQFTNAYQKLLTWYRVQWPQQQYSSTQVITKKRQPMLRSRVIFPPIREGASLSILHSLGPTTSVAS